MSRAGMLALAVAVLGASSCYLSHELGGSSGGGPDGGGAGRDAGSAPAVDACGARIVEITSGCTTFTLPATGTASCAYHDVAGVTGPSFVVHGPPGMSSSIAMSDAVYSIGLETDPCDVCSQAHGSDTGCPSDGCAWYLDSPPAPVRVVVQNAPDGRPVRASASPQSRRSGCSRTMRA